MQIRGVDPRPGRHRTMIAGKRAWFDIAQLPSRRAGRADARAIQCESVTWAGKTDGFSQPSC
eukprot:1168557-Pyramimonas_sp.AAC.1